MNLSEHLTQDDVLEIIGDALKVSKELPNCNFAELLVTIAFEKGYNGRTD